MTKVILNGIIEVVKFGVKQKRPGRELRCGERIRNLITALVLVLGFMQTSFLMPDVSAKMPEAGEDTIRTVDDASDAGEASADGLEAIDTEGVTDEDEEQTGTGIIKQDVLEKVTAEIATEMSEGRRRNIAEYIDLQDVVNDWARTTSGKAAVEIYDLDYQRVAASYQANEVMNPKSLYKLFYAYDAYTQIDAGVDDPNQPYLDGSTLGHCLDIMIRNSDNPCAEAMLGETAREARVGELVRNFGLSHTRSDGLSTSAHDVSLLLQRYWTHSGWSNASWAKFLDSARNQPAQMRRGLPSGFYNAVVYNKTGFGPNSNGYTYNDAAIVEFAGGRHYIIAAMTNGASQASLANLGMMIELVVVYE